MKKLGELFLKWYLLAKYNEKGAAAVEYAILVALIAIVIIAGVTLLGTKLLALFNSVAGKIPT